MVDMFFYRDPEEVEKEQQDAAVEKAGDDAAYSKWDVGPGPSAAGAINPVLVEGASGLDWADDAAPTGNEWAAEPAAGGWD